MAYLGTQHMNRVMSLSELSSSLAHEINQPLGAILNNVSATRTITSDSMEENEELDEILDDIANDANRAAQIIRNIRAAVEKRGVQYEPLLFVFQLIALSVEFIPLRATLESR